MSTFGAKVLVLVQPEYGALRKLEAHYCVSAPCECRLSDVALVLVSLIKVLTHGPNGSYLANFFWSFRASAVTDHCGKRVNLAGSSHLY